MKTEIVSVPLTDLSEDETIKSLVPEMTTDEWGKFLESCKKSGIRQPIDVRNDGVVLDGRHRYRAAKILNLTTISVIYHKLNQEQSIEFVRDTAIERRNLTAVQRVDIVLRSEELVKGIEQKAKAKQISSLQHQSSFGPMGPNEKPIRTDVTLSKLANTSPTTIKRMKKIKKVDPETYEHVVAGEISAHTVYDRINKEIMAGKKATDKLAEAKKTTPKIVKPNHDAEILEACVSPVLNMIGAVADLKKLWGDQAVEDAIKMIPQKYPDLSSQAVEALKTLNLSI
ncbi:ParB/RepB/Spo0J family partition protein [Lacticaseibacillus mingshuiensis]|uniref:ParB/RepB/Spo0J family partition protein n=1 Tax=Lacticaseibacillus mingshuiensis TaxID=2799574 RepID=UPI0019429176|nr:ParB/RepB/Spo0J family partition protein [Lacticaseibacillus mingshuiensis]